MHKSPDEFEFRQVPTTDYGVSCPLASEKSMYNVVNTLVLLFLIKSSSLLQVRRTTIMSKLSSKFSLIGPYTAELAALERLKKSPYAYNGRIIVNTLTPSVLIGSSSFMQKTMTCIKAWMSSNFNQIRLLTTEFPALERLKKNNTTKNNI